MRKRSDKTFYYQEASERKGYEIIYGMEMEIWRKLLDDEILISRTNLSLKYDSAMIIDDEFSYIWDCVSGAFRA